MAVEEENQPALEAEQPVAIEVENGIDTETEPEKAEAEVEDSTNVDNAAVAEEDDEVVVTIGEDSPPQEEEQKAPEWVRELRKSNRELQKENKALKAKQETPTENKPVELGKKPTLEELDYDSVAYDRELSAWSDRKRVHEDADTVKKSVQ